MPRLALLLLLAWLLLPIAACPGWEGEAPAELRLGGSLALPTWEGKAPAEPQPPARPEPRPPACPADVQPEEPRPLTVPGENRLLPVRLEFARQLVSEARWAEAIDDYQRLQRQAGPELVVCTTPGDQAAGCTRSLQVQRLCQMELARFPEAGLRLFQGRVESQARKWLEQGRTQRDEKALLRLVVEAFASPSAVAGLEILGDLAFERGDLESARNWWRLLVDPASEASARTTGRLRHPAVSEPARVRARLLLAGVFLGERDEVERELPVFRKRHSQERGELVGETGQLADVLERWWQRGRPLRDPPDWPTLGGTAARTGAAVWPAAELWSLRPSWRVPLTPVRGEPAVVLSLEQRQRRLRYVPAIAADRAIVCDGSSVRVHDLRTGDPLLLHGTPAKEKESEQPERHSLTADGDRIYSVLGSSDAPDAGTHLVCLNVGGGKGAPVEVWKQAAVGEDRVPSTLAGAPLLHAGRLLVLLRQRDKGHSHLALACHDADTGRRLWRQVLCSSAEDESPTPPHQFLTLAGHQVVCCTQMGLVIAVEWRTGRIVWAVRYPSRGPTEEGLPSPRELGTCLYHGHRVYLAPVDSDRLLCLDPDTGTVLWHRERIEVVHLLGCSHDRLIFTTPTGLRAVAARTGDDVWIQPEEGKLPPLGRGLLAGSWVVWPTAHPDLPLRLVHASTGQPEHEGVSFDPTQLRHIAAGHVALAQGCLVVATEGEMIGYVAGKGDKKPAVPPLFLPSPRTRGEGSGVRGGGPEMTAGVSLGGRHPSPPTPLPEYGARGGEPALTPPDTKWGKKKLAPPLLRSWEVRDAHLLVPASTASDTVFTLQRQRLQSRSAVTGAVTWETPLRFVPTWLDLYGGHLLLAGPAQLLALDVRDGTKCWNVATEEPPTAFQLAGDRLLYLQDGRRLVCRAAKSGRLLWSYWAPGAQLRPIEGGAIRPLYHTDSERVLLQTTGGQRFLLDSASGKVIHKAAHSSEPWPEAPLRLKQGLLVIEERTRVQLLDPDTGKIRWTYEPRSPNTLSGAPFTAVNGGAALLLFVPRNHGCDLERVDPATGKNLWEAQPRLSRWPPNGAVILGEAVHYTTGGLLLSRSLATGHLLREVALHGPSDRWRLQSLSGGLLLESCPPPPWVTFLWLNQGPLFVLLVRRSGERAILDWRDPDGRLRQRLNLTECASSIRVQRVGGGLVVEAGEVVVGFKSAE